VTLESELGSFKVIGNGTVQQIAYVPQGDHSPDNVKFPDNSLTVRGTPPRHSAC